VILATDVAETSLTIEGISAVVDSGLARKPRFDPNSGLSRLQVQPIPQASASQRAGRAGRLGPGHCYRAWSAAEHRTRPFQRPAEILEADLAPLVLELALWGITDPATLRWLNPPPVPAWQQALGLLQQLEALDQEGRITPHGRKIAAIGLHPRLGHLLVRGGSNNPAAADLAALISERDPWRGAAGETRPVDLELRLQAMEAMRQGNTVDSHFHSGTLHRLIQLSNQLRRRVAHLPAPSSPWSAAALLSLAYPERIAGQRDGHSGRFLLTSGKGGVLPPDDPLKLAPFLAIAQMDAGSREGRIWLALELSREELEQTHAHRLVEQEVSSWDPAGEKVHTRRIRRLDALELWSREVPTAGGERVHRLLLQAIRRHGLETLTLPQAARQLQARVALAATFDDTGSWPDLNEQTLLNTLEEWLLPWLDPGIRSLHEVRSLDWTHLLGNLLDWQQRQQLDRLLPPHWTLADGSRAPIDYTNRPPMLAVPVQKLYGTRKTPSVMRGRVLLQLHLLSPAGRPRTSQTIRT
jgi:ATP-dependent helicase HrpB